MAMRLSDVCLISDSMCVDLRLSQLDANNISTKQKIDTMPMELSDVCLISDLMQAERSRQTSCKPKIDAKQVTATETNTQAKASCQFELKPHATRSTSLHRSSPNPMPLDRLLVTDELNPVHRQSPCPHPGGN